MNTWLGPPDDAIPATWWPTTAGMIDHHRTRIELLDADDPDGMQRADDHAVGTSLLVSLAVFGAVSIVVPGSTAWTAPLLILTWLLLWIRATASGIWVTRSGVRAVSFPWRIDTTWATAKFTTQHGPTGDRIVVADHHGHAVALSMTQVASGVVFNRSRQWRQAALEHLAEHLTCIGEALR